MRLTRYICLKYPSYGRCHCCSTRTHTCAQVWKFTQTKADKHAHTRMYTHGFAQTHIHTRTQCTQTRQMHVKHTCIHTCMHVCAQRTQTHAPGKMMSSSCAGISAIGTPGLQFQAPALSTQLTAPPTHCSGSRLCSGWLAPSPAPSSLPLPAPPPPPPGGGSAWQRLTGWLSTPRRSKNVPASSRNAASASAAPAVPDAAPALVPAPPSLPSVASVGAVLLRSAAAAAASQHPMQPCVPHSRHAPRQRHTAGVPPASTPLATTSAPSTLLLRSWRQPSHRRSSAAGTAACRERTTVAVALQTGRQRCNARDQGTSAR